MILYEARQLALWKGYFVPAGAILIGEAPFDHMTTASARYVLPYHI